MSTTRTLKFDAGQVVITAGAHAALNPVVVLLALKRHLKGDWGLLCPEDSMMQNDSFQPGQEPQRLMSVWEDAGTRFWIITEWDRSATTVLLPDEY